MDLKVEGGEEFKKREQSHLVARIGGQVVDLVNLSWLVELEAIAARAQADCSASIAIHSTAFWPRKGNLSIPHEQSYASMDLKFVVIKARFSMIQ